MRNMRARRKAAQKAAEPAVELSSGPADPESLIRWLGSLTVSEGRFAGDPFRVLPWEAEFIRGAFGEGIQTAALTLGRGNGKSALTGALAAAAVAGPLARPRGEVLVVAASLLQAGVVFEHAKYFLGLAGECDRGRWRVLEGPHPTIVDKRTGAKLIAIGSDPKRAHGRAPLLAILDEPAQYERSTRDKMRAAIRTALGKQPGSRLIALGTRSSDPAHWFERMLEPGPGRYVMRFDADPEADPMDRAAWLAANPSLPDMPDLAETIATEAEETKTDPEALASFRALRLNAGVSDTTESVLIAVKVWQRCEVGELPEAAGPMVLGVDLGQNAAMSAVAGYWPDTGRLEVLAAFPAVPDLRERGLQDGVGGEYQAIQREGSLIVLPGRTVEVAALIEQALSRWGVPDVVTADRWRAAELRDALDTAKVPAGAFVERGQGFKDGAEDVRQFRRAVLRREVRALPSLLLRSALREARVATDPAGNCKLAKKTEGGRRATARDDTAAAAILAVAEGARRRRGRTVRSGSFRYVGLA